MPPCRRLRAPRRRLEAAAPRRVWCRASPPCAAAAAAAERLIRVRLLCELFGFYLNSNRIQIVPSHVIIEPEGVADPSEGQDPQDFEQGKSSLFFEHIDPNCEIILFTNKIACNDEHSTCDYAMP
uniref:Uncharacterized protein n=1 Tax=Oryza sativa subsp. japonica TaxID=39947 RepID=Q6L4I6_ORYSJ|nr:hypothetical protein [Oryza sativa Japonica Group]